MARSLSVIIVVVACFVVSAIAEEEQLYDSKYDDLDVDKILSNDRLRNQYYYCFLGTQPCLSPVQKFLKDKFPEAIVTKCRRCTEKQKEAFSKVAEWFTTNDAEGWDAILRHAVKDFTILGAARKAAASTTPAAR